MSGESCPRKITQSEIDREIPEYLIKRASPYIQSDRLTDKVALQDRILATVLGNYGTYGTSIYIGPISEPPERSLWGECTCPYFSSGYTVCKHIAALAVEWKDRPEEFVVFPPMERLAELECGRVAQILSLVLDENPGLVLKAVSAAAPELLIFPENPEATDRNSPRNKATAIRDELNVIVRSYSSPEDGGEGMSRSDWSRLRYILVKINCHRDFPNLYFALMHRFLDVIITCGSTNEVTAAPRLIAKMATDCGEVRGGGYHRRRLLKYAFHEWFETRDPYYIYSPVSSDPLKRLWLNLARYDETTESWRTLEYFMFMEIIISFRRVRGGRGDLAKLASDVRTLCEIFENQQKTWHSRYLIQRLKQICSPFEQYLHNQRIYMTNVHILP